MKIKKRAKKDIVNLEDKDNKDIIILDSNDIIDLNNIVENRVNLELEVNVAPTAYPDWAMLDLIAPESGSNNCIAPPLEKQQYGVAYAGVLERNFFNWTLRTISLWIRFLNGQLHTPKKFYNANKPSAEASGAGKMIYVQDLGSGGSMAFSDGTNWRKVSDNSIIIE